MKQPVFYFICGLLGVIFHSLLKYQSLRSDAIAANKTFPFVAYLQKDWVGIVLAIIPVFVWLLTFGEVAIKYPALAGYTNVSFVLAGAVGSYILQLVCSRAKKQIRDVVDVQSNIADSAAPGSTDEIMDKSK